MRQRPHHAQVVADEQVAERMIPLQAAQQVDDLRLLVGSSSTTKRGFSTIARATAMRWRWPPLNSCG
jgi:hypothetical protein